MFDPDGKLHINWSTTKHTGDYRRDPSQKCAWSIYLHVDRTYSRASVMVLNEDGPPEPLLIKVGHLDPSLSLGDLLAEAEAWSLEFIRDLAMESGSALGGA